MDALSAQSSELLGRVGERITWHINEIPAFVEVEIERIYGTLHSSIPFFKIFRSTKNVSTYTSWSENQPEAILLFQISGRSVQVLNEMIDLDEREIERFASYVFAKLPFVHIISFNAIRTALDRFAYPVQKHNAKDTYVITLPPTPDDYMASLSRRLRDNIQYSLRRVKRDHPSFESRFYETEKIPDDVLKSLIRLSEERISQKVADFSHDERRIIALAKQCGFVNVLTIDGKICGGTINYFIGINSFLELVARDLTYAHYSLGMVTNCLSVCETIRRGKKSYYLGGGRFDYKEKLLGVLVEADHVEIYRSRLHLVVHAGHAAKTLGHAYLRLAKVWVKTHQQHVISKFVTKLFNIYTQQRR